MALILCASCMQPIGGSGSASHQAGGSATSSTEAASTSRASSASSSEGLRIGSEYVTPEDIWRFERTRLIEATRGMDAPALRRYVEQEAARLVRDTVTERLLYQKATERLTPAVQKQVDGYVDAELRRIVTEEFGGVQRRYERDLRAKGLTLEQMRERMRREILIAGFLDAEIKPRIVEPSRADLLMAYEAYQRENRRPPRRRMSLIDVRIADRLDDDVTDPTPDQLAQARTLARGRIEAARRELEQGVPFAEVARRYSDGLHAAEGGSWGWVRRGSVRERFEPAVEALYALEAGAVSDIIETQDGFFIVRCDEIDDGGTPDFVSLQPELKQRFYRNMFNELVANLVEELRGKTRIDPADLDRLWQAAVREGLRIVQEARLNEGPPPP